MSLLLFRLLSAALTWTALVSGELTAHLSESGVDGSIVFSPAGTPERPALVRISLNLRTSALWSWAVHQLPLDYTALSNRCHPKRIGPLVTNLTELIGEVSNETVSLETEALSLTGPDGIWSRSLVLSSSNGDKACATIIASGNSSVKVAEASFAGENSLAGSVLFQWYGSQSSTDAVIYSDLYFTNPRLKSSHRWRIYTTDILESDADKARSDCNSLQVVLLELSERVGDIRVGERVLIRDGHLPQTELGNPGRVQYVVLLDDQHPDTFLSCARLRPKAPVLVKGVLSSHGVRGVVSLSQESMLTPTRVVLNMTKVAEPVLGGFRIHTLPPQPYDRPGHCTAIGDVYNPTSKPLGSDAPSSGSLSQDNYAVGDLSGKLGYVAEREWDMYLPLMGPHSVVHRTIVIYRNGEDGTEEPWVCSVLTRYLWDKPEEKHPVITAQVTYRYPIVGRIVLQQTEPVGETTVLLEGLVYSDGSSQNTTREHRWGIHVSPPGKDFFNWTARCVSAGPVYNPYKVNISKESEYVVGDLSARHQNIIIAGSKRFIRDSRMLFTDNRLPLTGRHSVFGKSLVIFDDHGPKARGDRLACSRVEGFSRRKGVGRDWYGNGALTSVSGRVEFLQQSPYSLTDVEINLEGLEGVVNYQVHMTPVLEELEFPCEESTLYGVYNPEDVAGPPEGPSGEPGASDLTGAGPLLGATPDQLRVGDLSGKFRPFDGHTPIQKVYYNDSNLPIFGPQSILGRSIVLHSKTGRRLACTTIERGYSPSEARELRAIASFHHPLGFAAGYIRMTQLVHNDGSMSDTVIEVNLRHPGKQDRNVTRNHNWAVYVNPVGVDATVKVLDTRCTAAGYLWNPYYTQLASPLDDELYRKECGHDAPLRCYAGDLSGRLGPIHLGQGRQVFSDSNLPLEGQVSAMGRSIVILDKEGGHNKFACANIEPDYDTVKYVNVRRPPKFVVAQFLEEVREVMGIPEWFLTVDSRKTKLLYNGACLQLLLHFKGPLANRMEQDFSRLLATGRLHEPSLQLLGYVPQKKRPTHLHHKLCSQRSPGTLATNSISSRASVSLSPSLPSISVSTAPTSHYVKGRIHSHLLD